MPKEALSGANPPKGLPPHLLNSFIETDYRVYTPSGIIHLAPQTTSTALSNLLSQYGAESCSLITAHNPRSALLAPEDNAVRQMHLKQDLKGRFQFLMGEGRANDRGWPLEHSVLVLGTDIEVARAISIKYQQLAFLFSNANGDVSLIFNDEECEKYDQPDEDAHTFVQRIPAGASREEMFSTIKAAIEKCGFTIKASH